VAQRKKTNEQSIEQTYINCREEEGKEGRAGAWTDRMFLGKKGLGPSSRQGGKRKTRRQIKKKSFY